MTSTARSHPLDSASAREKNENDIQNREGREKYTCAPVLKVSGSRLFREEHIRRPRTKTYEQATPNEYCLMA